MRVYRFTSYVFLTVVILNVQSLKAQTLQSTLPTGNGDTFIVIAHRGASAYAPENTLSAFKLAIEMRAEMIELDVAFSKDGVPVVIHDETLDRTTSGKGLVVNHTLAELKKMDTGSWFGAKFKGEPFPTLEEVLILTRGKIAVNIEIKHEAVTDEAKGGIVDKALSIVKSVGVQDQVIFSSFDYRVMEHLNKLAPAMPKAILYEKSQSDDELPSQLVEKYKVDAFNCSYKQLSDEWLKNLKNHDIPFMVYTVNDDERMRELVEKGAAGIFSDKPDVLKTIVDNL